MAVSPDCLSFPGHHSWVPQLGLGVPGVSQAFFWHQPRGARLAPLSLSSFSIYTDPPGDFPTGFQHFSTGGKGSIPWLRLHTSRQRGCGDGGGGVVEDSCPWSGSQDSPMLHPVVQNRQTDKCRTFWALLHSAPSSIPPDRDKAMGHGPLALGKLQKSLWAGAGGRGLARSPSSAVSKGR